MSSKNLKKVVTHSGNFHADEVFACAALSLLHDGAIEVVRSRDLKVWATGDYVVDVGGVYDAKAGRFDHHQEGGAGARENGIPYSSLGLVWKHFGEQICGSAGAMRLIDEKLVQPIDAADNGIDTYEVVGRATPYVLQSAIGAFRPTWKETNRTHDVGFVEALDVARTVMLREIQIARDRVEGENVVLEIYRDTEDKRLIVLADHYPWEMVLTKYPEPLYVAKPDHQEGNWKVLAVRAGEHTFQNRKSLPESWAGKTGEDFAQISGVHDARFCHNKRFIAVAGSKEGALALAHIALIF